MTPHPCIWPILVAAFVLAACSGPGPAPEGPGSAVPTAIDRTDGDARLSAELRLDAVTLPILHSAREFCGTASRPYFGLSADTTHRSARRSANDAGGGRYRLVQIASVVPTSPADDAGLRAGDVVLSANGVRPGRSGSRVVVDAMRDGGDRPLWLLTRRGETKRMVRVDPVEICDIPVELAGTFDVRAWSAGGKVRVGKGIIRFGLNDAELALIVSHELSHVILDHTGSFFGQEAVRIEDDADTMALYLMTRAGFQPKQSLSLFPRLRATFPGLDGEFSHVTLQRRCTALVRTIEEIAAKQAAGQDLTPEPAIWRNREPFAGENVDEPFADRLLRVQRRLRTPVSMATPLDTRNLQEACG